MSPRNFSEPPRAVLAALAGAVAAGHLWLLAHAPLHLVPGTPKLLLRVSSPLHAGPRAPDPAEAGSPRAQRLVPTQALTPSGSPAPASAHAPFPTDSHTPSSLAPPAASAPEGPEAPAAPVATPVEAHSAMTSEGAESASTLRLPPPQRLHYAVTGLARGQAVQGEGQLRWQHDGQRYDLTWSQATSAGQRTLHSTGMLMPAGLAPERFGDQQWGGPGRKSEQAAHFEHGANGTGRVRFSSNTPDAAESAGIQDRVSVWVQLAALVAGRPDLRQGSTLALRVVNAREALPWVFRVEGEVTLALPGGPQRALHLRRPGAGPYDVGVEVWLAPSLDYLPARLRLTLDTGDWLDQHWTGSDRN